MKNCTLSFAAGVVALFALVGCSSVSPFAQEEQLPPRNAAASAPEAPPPAEPAPAPAVSNLGTQPFSRAASANNTTVRGAMPATVNISQVTFAQEGADFDPCVSRDGQMIVYASTQHRPTADVYIKRVDSHVVTQLTNDPADDVMPVLSPDGARIAFATNRAGNWDIYVMPVTGGKAVQITSDPADELHPSWSPDGKQLVYSKLSQTSGRWEMWVCEANNTAVSHFIGYGLLPQWCPAPGTGMGGADRILFQLGRERGSRAFDIWSIDYADGMATNATEIVSQPGMALINPSWSPDGRFIAFAEVPAASDTGDRPDVLPEGASLWLISVEGTNKVRLTSGGGSAISPAWSGTNKLFFVCDRGGFQNIWSLDVSPALLAAGVQGKKATPVAGAGEK